MNRALGDVIGQDKCCTQTATTNLEIKSRDGTEDIDKAIDKAEDQIGKYGLTTTYEKKGESYTDTFIGTQGEVLVPLKNLQGKAWTAAGGNTVTKGSTEINKENQPATKAADANILHLDLNQSSDGNCACLAVLAMMAQDYNLREKILEPSIVKQSDGSFKVYLAGGDKEFSAIKGDSGKDEKGFYVTVSQADLQKYRALVNKNSDKDYLVLSTAAQKYAEIYGIRGDYDTRDGMFTEGLIALFTGKDPERVIASDSSALDNYFNNPGLGTIVFGRYGIPKRKLGKDPAQIIVGHHAYSLVPLNDGRFKVINPWDTKNPMVLTEKQLREFMAFEPTKAYISYLHLLHKKPRP